MKKYLALFAAVTLLSAITATAAKDEKKGDGSFDQKRCFKLCMKELDDRDKCTYVCDPDIAPKK